MAKTYRQTVITMAAAAILVPVIGGAAEQSGTAATGAAETPDEMMTGGLEEVVVTAQRREETLQRAAIAVSSVSGDQLAAAGISSPSDFSQLVPSLQITESHGAYPLFYLRGVGAIAGNAFQDTAVALNFDGVYIGRPSGANGLFFDLERVEVLKGPQGTLYGRNATGGAINIVPKKPILGEWGGSASAEVGNHGAYRTDGALNIPLGDRAALRAAAFHVQHDPYMNDGTDDQDMSGARLALALEPVDDLSIRFVADYYKQDDAGAGSTVIGNNVLPGLPTQFPGPAFDLDDRVGVTSAQAAAFLTGQPNTLLGTTFSPIAGDQYNDSDAWGVSSTLDWRTPYGTLTVVPAYRKNRVDYVTTGPGFQIAERGEDRQTSFEARFASNDDYALRYLVGAYYFDEEYGAPYYRVNSQSQLSFQEVYTSTRSKAAFSRLTYAVTDAVRLNAGVRYTEEEKGFRGTLDSNLRVCGIIGPQGPSCPNATAYPYDLTTALPASFPPFTPGPDGTYDVRISLADAGNDSYERTTWRVGVDWDVTEQSLLYVSYETGFKAGGFFFSSDEGTFEPETLKAYTLGSKNRFLDNRLQLNVELFYWDYTDQQLSHLGADSQGLIIFPTENVGAVTFKGVELEMQFLPVENTLLGLNAQYNDASYDRFVYSTPNFNGGASNGTGCPSAQVLATTYVVDCSGFRPPFAPRWTLNADVQQTFPLGAAGELVASAHAHYQTDAYTGTEFLPAQVQSSYTIADFALTYFAPEERYYVSGFVNNAFDKTVVSYSTLPVFSLWANGTLRAPRTYGMRAGMNF